MAKKIKIDLGCSAKPKQQVFNALAASADAKGYTSLSTITNSDVGICPKCKKPMGQAIIANSDTVFYCEADRVATPLPNKD